MERKKVLLVLKLTMILVLIVGIATTGYINYHKEQQESKSIPSKEYADIRKLDPESRAKPKSETKQDTAKLGVELKTQGTGFGRVLQSFAFDEHTGEIYTVQDESSKNNNLLINKLTSDGKSLGYITLTNFGHGNGLGLERLPDNDLRLWTDYIPVDSNGYGTRIARFNYDNPSEITSYDLCPPGYKVPFVAIENESRTLFMRAVNKNTKDERIFVFSLTEVLKGGTAPKSSFIIDSAQRVQSFQGLHAEDNVVYILTGNNSISSPKLLYGYDMSGKVLFKKKVAAGLNFAAKSGGYYEPEGLYVYIDPKTGIKRVYVGIVTGQPYNAKSNPQGRISRLYYYEDLE